MKPRRDIVPDNSTVHVYFRCNNKQRLLGPNQLKRNLLKLMAYYKPKYGVKIFDFCLMDNHVHLYMWTPNSDTLGNFMRTVLSQEAFVVNVYFDRDSQVFRSRYRSPVVTTQKYGVDLIKYIYGNRVKTGGVAPQHDPFCSAYWRLVKPYKVIENPKDEEEEMNNHLAMLIDDYVDPDILEFSKDKSFLGRMIDAAIRDAKMLEDEDLFRSSHTIGSLEAIMERTRILNSKSKGSDPPPKS